MIFDVQWVRPSLSAVVRRGVTTNRVVVFKRRGKAIPIVKPRPPKRKRKAQAPKVYRRDMEAVGKKYKTVCISLPVEELADFDAMAKRCQMARSDFLRRAARHFIVKIDSPGYP